VDEDEPGIAVGIAIDGQMRWRGGRGVDNLASATPLTTSTPFRICSITKHITSALIHRQVRTGRIA